MYLLVCVNDFSTFKVKNESVVCCYEIIVIVAVAITRQHLRTAQENLYDGQLIILYHVRIMKLVSVDNLIRLSTIIQRHVILPKVKLAPTGPTRALHVSCMPHQGRIYILEDFENASPYFCTFLANRICD